MDSFILMGDIIKSSSHTPPELMAKFKSVIKEANDVFGDRIVSPLTITLGDEFQGVIESLKDAIDIMIFIEQASIEGRIDFKLRYVLHRGEIETKINSERAHEMLGSGLTNARKELEGLKSLSDRFHFSLNQDLSSTLNKLFSLLQYFIDRWSSKDLETISHFLKGLNYRQVADLVKKDDSTLWRKRKTLAIDQYVTCKALIYEAIQ